MTFRVKPVRKDSGATGVHTATVIQISVMPSEPPLRVRGWNSRGRPGGSIDSFTDLTSSNLKTASTAEVSALVPVCVRKSTQVPNRVGEAAAKPTKKKTHPADDSVQNVYCTSAGVV